MSSIISKRKRSPGETEEEGERPRIKVRPMLTTSLKNFRDVRHPPSILSPGSGPPATAITRQDLNVRGARCFLLHSLLSPEECRHYIEDTERIGYSDLLDLFPPEYRSNDRVLAICEPLVEALWGRLQHHLTRREVIRIRPIELGNEGTWKPFRLNECCKFGKYNLGGHFSPHLDGPWVPHEDESSVFTVVIYLNSDYEGGQTRFLDEDTREEACMVTPKQGTALIFNHDTLHEGLPVTSGVKYILQTEIMFHCVDCEMIPDPMSYQSSDLTTLTVYQKISQAGDSQGFNDTYLEALRQQREAQRSVGPDAAELSQQPLPYEVYLKIFGYLSPHDLCRAMRVCKFWYDVAMDDHVWYEMYKKEFPIGIGLETQLDDTKKTLTTASPSFSKDWYVLFKHRFWRWSPQHYMVIDLGSFSCKCAVVDRSYSSVKTITTESVVAVVPGVFDYVMRHGEWERYFCGQDAKENFPDHLVNVVEGGVPVRAELLPEIVTGFYYACSVYPKYTPVVILEPPGLWNPTIRSRVAHTFVKLLKMESISFISTAVATLCGVELMCGVVVDVGHGKASCCAVWEGEERPGAILQDPLDCTAAFVANMVDTVVTQCEEEEMRAVLRERVVVTGGKAPKASAVEEELQKIHHRYSVIEPRSPVYSAVGGGCMLASLINFPVLHKAFGRRRSNMSPARFPVKQFYKKMLDWTVWMRVLEEHVRNTWDKVWCRGSSHAATLEMAGVTTVVYGQEMHPKPDVDRDIDMFLRERAQMKIPIHLELDYMDSCYNSAFISDVVGDRARWAWERLASRK